MDFTHILESVNQNISEALFRTSESGFLYVNHAYATMFGFKDEEDAINTHPIEVYQEPGQRERLIEKLLENHQFDNQEVTFVRRDGSEFIGLISAVVIKGPGSDLIWDGSIRDITKQRMIINELLDREQLLNSINKNINEAIYRSKKEGGLIYANTEFEKMFGYTNEDLLRRQVHDLYRNPADREVVLKKILEVGSITNHEVEFRRKNGSCFWGYLNSIEVKTQDGEIYFDGAIRDISKEKEADQLARKQAEMQELLIHISSGMINLPVEEIDEAIELSLHGLGEFVGADRTYIFEFSEDNESMEIFSSVKDGISIIRSTENNPEIQNQIKQHYNLLFQDKYLHIPDTSRVEDGPLRKVYDKQNIKSLLNVPLLKDGKCVGCVGFDWVEHHHEASETDILLLKLFAEMYSNIMERTARERQLRKLFDKTIEQNQRLKDFSYITSHNFRASVANFMGLITILEEDRQNNEFFLMMKDTALKLNLALDSINDMLNFEKDVVALQKKDCNLHQIITEIVELNKKNAQEEGINFTLDIDNTLYVKALPAYLQSIILNLVTNAMKYGVTEKKRNITIKAEKDRELVVLTVADEGIGIDMERFGDKLFRLGSRFHATMSDGNGMGLYITKQQVEAMGGKITVESEMNKGTKFKVYLNV